MFKRWFRNWLNDGDIKHSNIKGGRGMRPSECDPVIDNSNGLRFTVTAAQGGTVVSVAKYDRRKDEEYTALHVIPSDDDVATSIGYIVSVELLKS